jgi:hypothetical protein
MPPPFILNFQWISSFTNLKGSYSTKAWTAAEA